MPPYKRKVSGAMFDVKPAPTGNFDVPELSPRINLRVLPRNIIQESTPAPIESQNLEPILTKAMLQEALEASFADIGNPKKEITQMGVEFVSSPPMAKPRPRPIRPESPYKELDREQQVLMELQRPLPVAEPVEPEVPQQGGEGRRSGRSSSGGYKYEDEVVPKAELEAAVLASHAIPTMQPNELDRWWENDVDQKKEVHNVVMDEPRLVQKKRSNWSLVGYFFGAAVVVTGLVLVSRYGLSLKDQVVRGGEVAVENLEHAKVNLESFNFSAASDNFLTAYQEFSKAGEQINVFSGRIGSLLADLPGAGKLKSAQQLIEAGKLIAEAGNSMSSAVEALSKTGSILNPKANTRALLSEALRPLANAFEQSNARLEKAATLLAAVDINLIPEEKRTLFEEFREKLPQFQKLVADGSDYAKFLENFIGVRDTKKYVILFQNSSELRPTGGFPGSYGILTFENGRLSDLSVDDVYNLDGQLKELIVPPQQLQHITPNWGMRDASWFIDFPTSAKKVIEYYKKSSKQDVDGVVTITPEILANILKVVGSIEVPGYDLNLTSENFLAELQSEVEYGENKKINKPKKIIVDAAPLVLQKLYTATPGQWLELVNVFVAGLGSKDVMMYFKDFGLQSFVIEKGFTGDVKEAPGLDYVMVTVSNVKGAKTDVMTDSQIALDTYLSGEGIRHTLKITRTHNGGSHEYGFYNWENPSYMRVLVPKGSQFVSAKGVSLPKLNPLLDYKKEKFIRDQDLESLEATIQATKDGVATYEESGKTGFGFWMIVKPGETQTIELEYEVPASYLTSTYGLYVQKQPGFVVQDFALSVQTSENLSIATSEPELTKVNEAHAIHGKLEKDLVFSVTLE